MFKKQRQTGIVLNLSWSVSCSARDYYDSKMCLRPPSGVKREAEEVVKEEDDKQVKKKKKTQKKNEDEDLQKTAAIAAEVQAAKERALIPLEIRMKQFKDMLLERGVSLRL